MATSEFDDTIPTSTAETPTETEALPPSKQRSAWRRITLIGILALLLVAIISAFIGYSSGIAQRKNAETTLVSQQADQQFQLAQQDIDSQQYSRARQRLEYIAQIDPGYPGLTAKLAEVIMHINATATPAPEPTPTILPTVDSRGVEGIFSQAQQYYYNSDWASTIDTLLILRKTDPNYLAVDVDGMLFIAMRNRGIDKILKDADLEGGLYELTQAARFGPLDSEAQSYINWVSLYITGASFWDLDWSKVVEYFSQVGPAMPGLRDRSGMTATERWRLGLFNLGKKSLSDGDACTAAELFQASLNVRPDTEVEQAFQQASEQCNAGSVSPESGSPPPAIPVTETPPVGPVPPIAPTTPTP
jgi:hypothetical protein